MRRAKTEIVRAPSLAYRHAQAGTELFCDEIPLSRLAQRFGTPLYVYSAAMIRVRMAAFAKAFRAVPHTICYSVKANSTLAILRVIADQGAGFDVVSGGELERVMRVKRSAAANDEVTMASLCPLP